MEGERKKEKEGKEDEQEESVVVVVVVMSYLIAMRAAYAMRILPQLSNFASIFLGFRNFPRFSNVTSVSFPSYLFEITHFYLKFSIRRSVKKNRNEK